MKSFFLLVAFAAIISLKSNGQSLNFTFPVPVCQGTQFQIHNLSPVVDSTLEKFTWNFCNSTISNLPITTNLGTIGGNLNTNAFTAVATDSGHYYTFTTNYNSGELVRADFGNSLLNTPTSIILASSLGYALEGVQIAKDSNRWIIFTVSSNQINRLELGASLSNTAPIITNLGNIGNLNWPHDFQLAKENGNWYGVIANRTSSAITKLSFGSSLLNIPTGIDYPFSNHLWGPSGVFLKRNTLNGDWILFVSNLFGDSLSRFNFGTTLSNSPIFMDNTKLKDTANEFRDVTIMESCNELKGFGVYKNSNTIVQFEFAGNDISGAYTNIVRMDSFAAYTNQPHGLTLPQLASDSSNDKVIFITDVSSRLVRLDFPGCTNSSIPVSNNYNPPLISFDSIGTYTITLIYNQGQPDQITFCKDVQVVICTGTNDMLYKNEIPDEVIVYDLIGRKIFNSNYSTFVEAKKSNSLYIDGGFYLATYLKNHQPINIEKFVVLNSK
jgi:hypothetical protein